METIERYRQTAYRRKAARQQKLTSQRERAWVAAKRAAQLLKDEFGATRVVVFGSVLHPALFHTRSDIDLAVWGLAERDYYRAVSHVLSLDPEISVDLIEFEHARPALQQAIQEGIVL